MFAKTRTHHTKCWVFALILSAFVLSPAVAFVQTGARWFDETARPLCVPNQVLVRLRVNQSENALAEFNAEYGTRVVRSIPPGNVYLLETSATGKSLSQILGDRDSILKKYPAITYVGPNRYRYPTDIPNDEFYPASRDPQSPDIITGQWQLQPDPDNPQIKHIYAPEAWDIEKGSSKVVVAVVDTGVRPFYVFDDNGVCIRAPHPDLVNRILPGGVDFGEMDYDPSPPEDDNAAQVATHGTHCAGIIAAQANNSIGIAGVCWNNVWILPVKIAKEDGSMTLDAVLNALWYCANAELMDPETGSPLRVNVVSMSFGSQYPDELEEWYIKYASRKGLVLVGAAGNSWDSEPYPPVYPGAYEDVICVGATGYLDEITSFSQRGSRLDIVAPGWEVLSTVWYKRFAVGGQVPSVPVPGTPQIGANQQPGEGLIQWPDPQGNTFQYMSGTSMACPHVSAAAALLISHGVPYYDVKKILCETATPRGIGRPNDTYGWGLLNLEAAVKKACIDVEITTPGNGAIVTTTRPRFRIDFRRADPATIRVWIDDTLVAGPAAEGPAIPNWREGYHVLDATAGTTYLVIEYPVDPEAGNNGVHTIRASAVTSTTIDVPPALPIADEDTHTFRLRPRTLEPGFHFISIPYTLDPSIMPEDLFGSNSWILRWGYGDGSTGQWYWYCKGENGGTPLRYDPEATFAPPSVVNNLLVCPLSSRSDESSVATPPAGLGYFVKIPEGEGVPLPEGFGTTIPEEPYTVALYRGWNMVGCPFNYPIQWSNVIVEMGGERLYAPDAAAAGWIGQSIFNYDSYYNRYRWRKVSDAIMKPWEGQWVRVLVDGPSVTNVQNGGFSGTFVDGVASGWAVDESGVGTASLGPYALVGPTGVSSQVQKVSLIGGMPGAPYDVTLYQTVPAQEGTRYSFSVWTRRTGVWGDGEYTQVGIDPFGGIDPQGDSVEWSSTQASIEEWTQQTAYATAQSPNVTVFIKARSASSTLQKTAYLESARLTGGYDVMLIIPPSPYEPSR